MRRFPLAELLLAFLFLNGAHPSHCSSWELAHARQPWSPVRLLVPDQPPQAALLPCSRAARTSSTVNTRLPLPAPPNVCRLPLLVAYQHPAAPACLLLALSRRVLLPRLPVRCAESCQGVQPKAAAADLAAPPQHGAGCGKGHAVPVSGRFFPNIVSLSSHFSLCDVVFSLHIIAGCHHRHGILLSSCYACTAPAALVPCSAAASAAQVGLILACWPLRDGHALGGRGSLCSLCAQGCAPWLHCRHCACCPFSGT